MNFHGKSMFVQATALMYMCVMRGKVAGSARSVERSGMVISFGPP
jgi:hypothetical protein